MKTIFAQTKRLFLRPITEADFDVLYEMNTDAEVMRYIGNGKIRSDKTSVHNTINTLQKWYAENRQLAAWATIEKTSNTMIGWHSLKHLPNSKLVEVGYRLRKAFWGKGYATEMAKALIDYGFNQLGLNKIVGITHPENEPSKRVLQKCGLGYVGKDFYYNTKVDLFEILAFGD